MEEVVLNSGSSSSESDDPLLRAFDHNVTHRDFDSDIGDDDNCDSVTENDDSLECHETIVPSNDEEWIAMRETFAGMWSRITCDGRSFLNTSLEKVASYLDREKLRIARFEFFGLVAEDFELLTRKGVFPYEYVDSVDKLLEIELPPIEAFYSSLTGETVSDYEHARRVWKRFRVRTLGKYSHLYLKTDVLLLANVFENFRDTCMESYSLDPAHYFTLLGYTWDAMLKYTNVRFDLLTDIDMVMFVERGIRGGLSQCSNRYARVNNQYESSYDSSQPSSYVMYYDVNNLYEGHVRALTVRGISKSISNIRDIFTMAMWIFRSVRHAKSGNRNKKLLATVYDKSRYVTHYRNLQQYVRHSLRVTKIYRVLRFAQSPWLRAYIELNTERRTRASNEFERNLYKLMNNAIFGKTMENMRDHVDVRLVTRNIVVEA
ncbi:uncharacterized protein LOC105423012 [Pogonomyrmex barbatus]|uniref:Uncharacterized protein LOC105423012 n=1 Tax=Pogonomyrmex barbatus TaxID=144034 RepID=A0A6I9WGU7_9HYME|nr:uncharacterized protein LOC105423012 [Pogonomyrmex barbatus]